MTGTDNGTTSLSSRAYTLLRDRIVHLELKPMSVLSERELSRDLGVGLQPVREALRQLESERLVTIVPRRGTFVSQIAFRDERSVAEPRIELEALCAALAAGRATREERAELVDIADSAATSFEERIALDERFHRTLFAAAHNRFLERTLNQYYSLSLRIWLLGSDELDLAAFDEVDPDHRATARAVFDGDSAAARDSISEHIARSSSGLARIFSAGAHAGQPHPTSPSAAASTHQESYR